MSFAERSARPSILPILVPLLLAALCLAPWVRNRTHIRDFMDYGLVMAASARIEAGQTPYRDFVTPIQSLTFWLNHHAEQFFGGTYQAMTVGNALLILVAFVGLGSLLRTRLDPTTGWMVAAMVVMGSLTQHTIIWYNAMGVVCLAAVAWGTAMCPVLDKTHWRQGLAIVLGLIMGGANKLNFHLLAVGFAVAWTLRFALLQRASWRVAASSMAAWLIAGLLVPLGLELWWSDTSWSAWYHSVVELPLSDRGQMIQALFQPRFYWQPFHDYYGPVLLPQAGLITVLWVGVIAAAGFRERPGLDRIMLGGAGAMTIVGIGGLLATNHEIIYVTLACTVVLATALVLGFSAPDRPPQPRSWYLLLPALLIGGCSWWSAWHGQRSQFGFSAEARSTYYDVSTRYPEYGYLRGTLIPPGQAAALEQVADQVARRESGADYPHFYTLATEWLERVWPAVTPPRLPLWYSSLSYGDREHDALEAALVTFPYPFERIFVVSAWYPYFSYRMANILHLQLRWERQNLGVIDLYRIEEPDYLPEILKFRGNLSPAYIRLESGLEIFPTHDGQYLMGSVQGKRSWQFTQPVNRMDGKVRVERQDGQDSSPLRVKFEIADADAPDAAVIWSQEVSLAAGAMVAEADYQLDTRGKPTRFTVEFPAGHAGKQIVAGWFMPRIQHSPSRRDSPPLLRPFPGVEQKLMASEITSWSRQSGPGFEEAYLRHGNLENGELTLAPGGQLWLKPSADLSAMQTVVSMLPDEERIEPPLVWAVWYGGGRIELHRVASADAVDGQLPIRSWKAEPGGWFGFLVDPSDKTPGVRIEFVAAEHHPSP